MSTPSDFTRMTQEQVLEGIRQSQKMFVDAVQAWSRAAVGQTPSVPTFSGQLPQPEEVAEQTFEFAHKLIDAQRDFALSLLRAADASK